MMVIDQAKKLRTIPCPHVNCVQQIGPGKSLSETVIQDQVENKKHMAML